MKLLPLAELNLALEQQIAQTEAASQRADAASQRTRELEAQIAEYQQQLGLPPN